jgi:uncharacterized delta-60 repeat protein
MQLAIATILGCVLSVVGLDALAKPGDPDPAFIAGCRVPVRLPALYDVLLAPDGKILEVGSNIVVRCMPDGAMDPSFAGGFGVYAPTNVGMSATAAVLQPDGKLVTAGTTTLYSGGANNRGVGVMRINVDGFPDQTFGVYGGESVPMSSEPLITGAVVQPDGKIVVAGTTGTPPAALLMRFAADGSLDTTFGDAGFARMPAAPSGSVESVNGLLRQPDGKLVIVGAQAASHVYPVFALARFDSDGLLDTSFGVGGVVTIDFRPLHRSVGFAVAQLADGRLLTSGVVADDDVPYGGASNVALARLRDDGTLDTSFAYGGKMITPFVGVQRAGLAIAPDGKIVVVAVANPTHALRFGADGFLDASFGSGGKVPVASLGPTPMPFIVQPDNKLVVARTGYFGFAISRYLLDGPASTTTLRSNAIPSRFGQAVTLTASVVAQNPTGTVTFQEAGSAITACQDMPLIAGPGSAAATCAFMPTSGQHSLVAVYSGDAINPSSQSLELLQITSLPGMDTAIEFYHAEFDHYFTTALPAEVGKLDTGATAGWQRTGWFFPVWPLGTPDTQPVCRFWSGQRFAPKSSHFYTPYASECAIVKTNPDWAYEGVVMAFGLPDGGGHCAPSTQPLYRDYNSGQGGAPNHRYYTDRRLDDEMAYRGWISEGDAVTHVFACVPQGIGGVP